MAVITPNLNPRNLSIFTDNLGGPGPIAFDSTGLDTLSTKRNEIIDYIRLRLGDQIVDVELDRAHYDLAIKQALLKYRQRTQNSLEESYVFLDLIPEVQEYILPSEIMTVRCIYRRGIGSVTGSTASQFEPFASGYLNTYMLVAGRVGGLVNYELFAQYQELAMKMFGGYINFTWNSVSKKLTIMRKIPNTGHIYIKPIRLESSSTAVGSTITIETKDVWNLEVGDSIVIDNCKVKGYNNSYQIESVDVTSKIFTITAKTILENTAVVLNDLRAVQISSNKTDFPSETVMLQVYNRKPDVMLMNDHMVFPWLQEYAYSFAKRIVGEARSKFSTIAGPQGGASLNGDALKQESQAEMEKLEEELKNYVDGSTPLTWVTG